jgi:hypothetical protein
MTNETQTGTAVAVSQSTPSPTNFLEVIARAASDPTVDPAKMHGLLDVQERMMNKQAELDFNSAFILMQDELPRITKDSAIKHNGRLIAKYASYEKIDEVIRPILKKHGFALRFNSGPNGGEMIVEATLSHIGGHTITDRLPLKVEKVAAMNSAQAAMSAITYAKRGLTTMLLNLVFEGEDDDGKNADHVAITDDMAAELKDLIRETSTNTQTFLATMVSGAKSVDEIAVKDYDRVRNTLLAKRNKMGGAA